MSLIIQRFQGVIKVHQVRINGKPNDEQPVREQGAKALTDSLRQATTFPPGKQAMVLLDAMDHVAPGFVQGPFETVYGNPLLIVSGPNARHHQRVIANGGSTDQSTINTPSIDINLLNGDRKPFRVDSITPADD